MRNLICSVLRLIIFFFFWFKSLSPFLIAATRLISYLCPPTSSSGSSVMVLLVMIMEKSSLESSSPSSRGCEANTIAIIDKMLLIWSDFGPSSTSSRSFWANLLSFLFGSLTRFAAMKILLPPLFKTGLPKKRRTMEMLFVWGKHPNYFILKWFDCVNFDIVWMVEIYNPLFGEHILPNPFYLE